MCGEGNRIRVLSAADLQDGAAVCRVSKHPTQHADACRGGPPGRQVSTHAICVRHRNAWYSDKLVSMIAQ